MLTREQIEEIQTERREKGIPTKRTLRRSKAVSGNFASAEIGSFSFGRNRQN